jgi:hypothetical protein
MVSVLCAIDDAFYAVREGNRVDGSRAACLQVLQPQPD